MSCSHLNLNALMSFVGQVSSFEGAVLMNLLPDSPKNDALLLFTPSRNQIKSRAAVGTLTSFTGMLLVYHKISRQTHHHHP